MGKLREEEERRRVEVAQHLQTKTLESLVRQRTTLSCSKGWATDGKQSLEGGAKEDDTHITYLFQMDLIRAIDIFPHLGNERHICSKFCPLSCSLQVCCTVKMTKQYCRRTRLFEGGFETAFAG